MDGVGDLEVDVGDFCTGDVDFEVLVLCASGRGSVEENGAVEYFAFVKCGGQEGRGLVDVLGDHDRQVLATVGGDAAVIAGGHVVGVGEDHDFVEVAQLAFVADRICVGATGGNKALSVSGNAHIAVVGHGCPALLNGKLLFEE